MDMLKLAPVLKSLVTCLISCAIVGVFGELSSRLWINTYGDALDVTRHILEMDSQLGWKQRPHLNTDFLGKSLMTDSRGWREQTEAATNGILVIGPSSTFGWGVSQDQTYPAHLQSLISTPVINAGEIGYSSAQGVLLFSLENLAALNPKAIIIAYGLNDLDRYRFYGQSNKSDAEQFQKPNRLPLMKVLNLALSSSMLSVMFDVASWLRRNIYAGPSFKPPSDPVPGLRGDAESFRDNLLKMVAYTQRFGSKVILLTTATNYPIRTNTQDSGKPFQEAQAYWRAGNLAACQKLLSELVAKYPDQNEPYYYLGAIAKLQEDQSQAKKFIKQAMLGETRRIQRDIMAYNEIIRSVGRQTGVSVGEIDSWLGPGSQQEYFVDPVHFSDKGNRLIARALRDMLVNEGL